MARIQLNNISLYYEKVGSGRALLFLHGLGSSGADWMLQIPNFSSRYTVLTPDLRGHGQSDMRANSFTVEELARDMALLLEALQIESADVVGLSLGSFVALQLALDYPAKVHSLTLAGTTACVKDIGIFPLMVRKLLLALLPMPIVAKVVAYTCFPGKEQTKLRKMSEARMAANDKSAYKKVFSSLIQFDVKKRLAEIHCPLLLICGQKDRLVPKRHAEEIQKACPGARLEVIQGAGHIMPIDSPEKFNSLLLQFLESI